MPQSAANGLSKVPNRIGKYEIINEIGKGTTGNVYLSHDPYYGRDVAIKVYHIDAAADGKEASIARKMFFNEAHIVGMLQHPNILPIYDAGEEAGKYYVVMEHVQGARTLGAYCRPDNLLPLEDLVKIIFKCAKALHYAHGRGLIHRDIKPNNIMLTPDNDVRIIDFGIAIKEGSKVSQIRGIAGSPSYMSPEQVQSGELSPASDLYSLGAVLYELLTGFRPFRGSDLSKLLNQIVYATPAPVHTLRTNIPEELEEVVAISMQKEPITRYQSGAAMAAAMTRVHQKLQEGINKIDAQEHFDILRRLNFFHDFSQREIRELLRASEWREYGADEEIVREGDLDDRFYILVSGHCIVERGSRDIARLRAGNCFGESGYVRNARRNATIRSEDPATILTVSATLLEQVSTECQLRFTKVFLQALIERLQGQGSTAAT